MVSKIKLILGAAGFLLFGLILGASGSSHSDVNSTAPSRSVQTTVSPIQHEKPMVKGVTIAPRATLAPTLTPKPTIRPTTTPTPTKYIQPTTANQSSGLSNDDYYTNVDGNQVHTPVQADSVPAGATAICGDGNYSFSQHRSGTCSHHGGVAQWL